MEQSLLQCFAFESWLGNRGGGGVAQAVKARIPEFASFVCCNAFVLPFLNALAGLHKVLTALCFIGGN